MSRRPRPLFESAEDDAPPPSTLTINAKYASAYESVKRRQEMQRLTNKYGHVQAFSSDDDEDEEESEDDEARLLNDENESDFVEVFTALRRGEKPAARPQESADQAEKSTPKSERGKGFQLKDELQRTLVGMSRGVDLVEDDAVVEPGHRRKRSLGGDDAVRRRVVDAMESTVSSFHLQPATPKTHDHETTTKKTLEGAFHVNAPNPQEAEQEAFLCRYFTLEGWKGGGDGASEGETRDERLQRLAQEDEDERFYDEAERWESEFQQRQHRYEEGEEAAAVTQFARSTDGTLRVQSTTRKEARERRRERQQDVEAQAVSELRRLKALKRREIQEQRELIAKIAGSRDCGWTAEDLEADFDPATFDAKMSALFDDAYDGEFNDDEERHMEGDVNGEADPKVLFGGFENDLDVLYPEEHPSATVPELEAELRRKEAEYDALHFDRVGPGGVKTRFPYRPVHAEGFGLTDEDILTTDDRTLNMMVPLNCYATYLTRTQNVKDRFRALHRMGSMRTLDPERKSRRYGDLRRTVLFDANAAEEEEGTLDFQRDMAKARGEEEPTLTDDGGRRKRKAKRKRGAPAEEPER